MEISLQSVYEYLFLNHSCHFCFLFLLNIELVTLASYGYFDVDHHRSSSVTVILFWHSKKKKNFSQIELEDELRARPFERRSHEKGRASKRRGCVSTHEPYDVTNPLISKIRTNESRNNFPRLTIRLLLIVSL